MSSVGCGHILIVSPSAYLYGGLATWLDYLAPGLEAQGWRVTVGLVEGPRHHQSARYAAEHSLRACVPIRCGTSTPEGRRRALVRAIRQLRPDIVASVNIPDVYPAVAEARRRGASDARAVMTLHGIQADLYDDLRQYAPLPDAVVATNRLAARLASCIGGMPPDRVLYAPYGVAPTNQLPSERSPPTTLRIAWVGRFEEGQKRILDVPRIAVRIVEAGVPFRLLLAGDGPDQPALERALAPFLAAGTVGLLGRLGPCELDRQVYAQSDVLLLTSAWETGPIVVWEAMARGVAVVSSRYVGSGLEGALEDGVNALLFPIGDSDAAARQLLRLWEEPQLRERLVLCAKRTVDTRYSIAVSVGAWGAAFKRILSLAPANAAPSEQRRAGRLDRVVGARWAESIRSLVPRLPPDGGPGGEWPHSYGTTALDDPEFWRVASQEDVGGLR